MNEEREKLTNQIKVYLQLKKLKDKELLTNFDKIEELYDFV